MARNRLGEYLEILVSLIGIVVLIYLLASIHISKIIQIISGVDITLIILSSLIVVIRIPLGAYKWRILARDQKIDIKYIKMLKFYLIGYFFSFVTPGGIGNYIRIKFLHDSGKDLGVSSSNVIIDNLIEIINLYLISLLCLMLLLPKEGILIYTVIILLVTSLFSLFLLLIGKTGGKITKKILLSFIPSGYRKILGRDIDSIFKRPPSARVVAYSFLISIFTWILSFIQIYPVFLALRVNIGLLNSVSMWATSISISSLPITIGGLGIREGIMIYLSSFYGIDRGISMSVSLLGYLVTFILPSIFGGLLSAVNILPNFRHDRRR